MSYVRGQQYVTRDGQSLCAPLAVMSVTALLPLLAIVYFKPSTLKKTKHLQHPSSHHSSVCPHEPQDFCPSITNKHIHTKIVCGRLQRTDCHRYSKENWRKTREWRHTSDLTALPVTSHDIMAIYSLRESAPCVNALHRQHMML